MVAAAAALAFSISACSWQSEKADPRPGVVATTQQIGALTREVAGDHVALTVLVPPGTDPHEYDPLPKDVVRVGDSKVVLRNGLGIDDFLKKAIEGAGAKNVVTVTNGVHVLEAESEGGKREPDPHVWHNPQNDIVMVRNIAKALAAVDPANADVYAQNADSYAAKLEQVDGQIREMIDSIPPENRRFVTDHDSFGYFVEHYGLELVGTVIPGASTGAEASPQQIAKLEDTIRREHVKAIFAETSVDPKVAKQVAKDTGVTIVTGLYGDSLGPRGSGAETIDGMLLSNAQKIVEALR